MFSEEVIKAIKTIREASDSCIIFCKNDSDLKMAAKGDTAKYMKYVLKYASQNESLRKFVQPYLNTPDHVAQILMSDNVRGFSILFSENSQGLPENTVLITNYNSIEPIVVALTGLKIVEHPRLPDIVRAFKMLDLGIYDHILNNDSVEIVKEEFDVNNEEE